MDAIFFIMRFPKGKEEKAPSLDRNRPAIGHGWNRFERYAKPGPAETADKGTERKMKRCAAPHGLKFVENAGKLKVRQLQKCCGRLCFQGVGVAHLQGERKLVGTHAAVGLHECKQNAGEPNEDTR